MYRAGNIRALTDLTVDHACATKRAERAALPILTDGLIGIQLSRLCRNAPAETAKSGPILLMHGSLLHAHAHDSRY